MKKKFLFVLLIVFVVCLSLTLFSACDNGNKIDSSGAGGSISDASGNSSGTTAYSINFVADGSIYAKISTKGNEIVNLPANPEKVGYVFDGWYFDNEVWEKPFTANSLLDTSLSIDMYVYAKSMPITYNIKYELNGGENNSANPTTYTIESEKIVLQTPSKTGYDFVGWYADEELTEKVEKISTGSSGDRKFYAKWIPVYAIEYELNGGVNNSANPTTYTIESEDIVLQNPSKTDYDFVGWYSDEDLTEKVEKIASSSCGNKKFYAKWSSKYYLFDTYNKTIIGVTDYAKTCSSLVIPEQINGIDVSGIGNSAFSNCSKLNSVTIPDSVTSIGNSAFSGCAGLTSVYYAGDIASWCGISGLENIMSGSRTLYIGGKKVEGELVVPNSVKSISDSAFSYCEGLTSVIIADSVTSIGTWAFSYCTGLTSVTIGNSVMRIGDWAFSYCKGLVSVTFGNSVTRIGDLAFWKCTSLIRVIIPDSVTNIGNSAFSDCTGLTSATIGNSVTKIGNSAFLNCARLTSVTIPDSVTSIGKEAFYGCRGLASVTIGNGVTSIGDYAFYVCTKLTGVTIPDSVTSIGDYAFKSCSMLSSMIIGNSVASIGNNAFDGCKGLTSVIIPDSVTSIGNNAFDGCTKLASVIIPDSVTSIGKYVFNGCTGLTSVTIGNGVTSIGSSMFCDCSMLSSVTIGNSVKSIGDDAFRNCTRLTSVYYAGDIASWCGISGLHNIMSSSRTLYIGGNKVEGELIIPNSVTSISKYAFYGCVGLTSVIIADSVKSIGYWAFSYCKGLTSVTIGNSLTSISWGVFDGCSGLVSVTIGTGVTNIESYAFDDCSSLKTIYYKGTKEQWDAIIKDAYWDMRTGNYTIVYNA